MLLAVYAIGKGFVSWGRSWMCLAVVVLCSCGVLSGNVIRVCWWDAFVGLSANVNRVCWCDAFGCFHNGIECIFMQGIVVRKIIQQIVIVYA